MLCHNCGPAEGITCDYCRAWKGQIKAQREHLDRAHEEQRRIRNRSDLALAEERARHKGELETMRQRVEVAEKRLRDMTDALKRALAG